MRMCVRSLALLKDPALPWAVGWVADMAQILHCCGCAAGQQLQLQLDPYHRIIHWRWVPTKKKIKKKKKKNMKVSQSNLNLPPSLPSYPHDKHSYDMVVCEQGSKHQGPSWPLRKNTASEGNRMRKSLGLELNLACPENRKKSTYLEYSELGWKWGQV